VAAANELGAEGRAPGGPRKTSGYIAVAGKTIVHKRTTLSPAGPRLERILAAAAAGDPDGAYEDAGLVSQMPEPRRSDHYVRRPDGMVFTHDGPLPDAWKGALARGELVELSEREIREYLETGGMA
jgi:hypothetical protein